MTEHTNPATGEEQPCFVRHEDAGGPCGREAVMEVYGLPFCELHGQEAKVGAALEEQHEVGAFLERLGTDFPPVGRALARLEGAGQVTDSDYWEAPVLSPRHPRTRNNRYP